MGSKKGLTAKLFITGFVPGGIVVAGKELTELYRNDKKDFVKRGAMYLGALTAGGFLINYFVERCQ